MADNNKLYYEYIHILNICCMAAVNTRDLFIAVL